MDNLVQCIEILLQSPETLCDKSHSHSQECNTIDCELLDQGMGYKTFITGRDGYLYKLGYELAPHFSGKYKATCLNNAQEVLIETLRISNPYKDYHLINTWTNEKIALMKMSHPNIIEVYDIRQFFVNDTETLFKIFAIKECLTGEKLKDYIYSYGEDKLSLVQAIEVISQIGHALDYIWNNSMQCYLSPDTIQVTTEKTVKLTQIFSLYQWEKEHIPWDAPEELNGNPKSYFTDVYRFGGIFYYLLTGIPPYYDRYKGKGGKNLIKYYKKTKLGIRKPTPPENLVPDIPKVISKTIMAMLEKKPHKRFGRDEMLPFLENISSFVKKDNAIECISVSENFTTLKSFKASLIDSHGNTVKTIHNLNSGIEPGKILTGKKGHFYKVLEQIGNWSLGRVYKAKCLNNDLIVTIKVINWSAVANLDFFPGAWRSFEFTHPNLLKGYDLCSLYVGQQVLYYFVLEYFAGHTLQECIDATKRYHLEIPKATKIIWEVAKALSYLSERSLVHNNITLHNVCMDSNCQVKLTSLEYLTENGEKQCDIRNHPYLPPEVVKGKATDFRSDIYSLGAVYYHILTGTPPFIDIYKGNGGRHLLEYLIKIRTKKMPTLPHKLKEMPDSVSMIVMKMLQTKPANRFTSYNELLKNLYLVRENGGEDY